MEQYNLRKYIIEKAFDKSKNSGYHSLLLDHLIDTIRTAAAENPDLASFYFSGGFEDHPYFIKTDNFAIGLSVLPEDEKKLRVIKKHPHQVEIIVVVRGSILVDIRQTDKWKREILEQGNYFLINRDLFHR